MNILRINFNTRATLPNFNTHDRKRASQQAQTFFGQTEKWYPHNLYLEMS